MLSDKLASNSTSLQRTVDWRQTTITPIVKHSHAPGSPLSAMSVKPPAACVHVAISWKGRAGPCMDAEMRTKKTRESTRYIPDLASFDRSVTIVGTSSQCDGEMYSERKHTTPDCASGVPFRRMRGVVQMRNEKEQKLSKSKPHSKT